MPLMPKRVKFRKTQRGNRGGNANSGTAVSYGDYGLQTLNRAWLAANQIEACRVAINRHLKRKGKLWIRVFPHKPVTSRPPETRMGKGKGNPEYWVAVVKPGRIMFELEGVGVDIAREAMSLAAHKLPIKTKFIQREEAQATSEEQ